MRTGWKTVFVWVAAAVVMAAVGLGPIQVASAQDSTRPAIGAGKTMEMQMSDSAHAAMMKAQEAKMSDSTPKAAPADTATPASKAEEKPKTEAAPADTTTPVTKAEEKSKTEAAPADTTTPASKPEEKPKTETPVDPKAPYKSVTFAKGEKPRVIMETTQGRIVIELWPEAALKHCQSFAYLAEKGFFDSLTFHRIVPSFVIQGGDPKGNGTGGPGYTIPAEFSETLLHEDGILSMARAGDPNSAGSQFFICLGRLSSLDKKYTIFGKVVEGLDIVHKIEKVPVQGERPVTPVVMTKVYLEKKG